MTFHRIVTLAALIGATFGLAGCGGGNDSSATAVPPTAVVSPPTVVARAASPIAETSGVSVSLQDGASVFALASGTQDTSRMTISAAPVPAGADVSQMVGRAVLKFTNLPSGKPLAVVRSGGEVVRVYECDASNLRCARLATVTSLEGGAVLFPVVEDKFYAVQKR